MELRGRVASRRFLHNSDERHTALESASKSTSPVSDQQLNDCLLYGADMLH
jgi:hypothetical protein